MQALIKIYKHTRILVALALLLCASAASAVDLVIYSGSNYLSSSDGAIANSTTFDPQTCIWSGTSGGTFTNRSGVTLTVGGYNSWTYDSSNHRMYYSFLFWSYYIVYNGSWKTSTSSSATGMASVYTVTETDSEMVFTADISGASTIPNTVSLPYNTVYTASNVNYKPEYAKYSFNTTDIYVLANGSSSNTKPTLQTVDAAELNWAVTPNSYCSIAESTGVLTVTSLPATANVDVEVSMSYDGVVNPTTKTVTLQYKPNCATPQFSYAGNTGYLTITTATDGATIYYTTDGTTPGVSSTAYTAPFAIVPADGLVVKAIAVKNGYQDSEVGSIARLPLPVVNVGETSITVECDAVDDVTFHYTTDGTTPTVASASTTETIPIAGLPVGAAIKVMAVKSGWFDSAVATATYKQKLPAPTIEISGTTATISLAVADPEIKIYYTTDGSDPTASSTLYTDPFSCESVTVIKAVAIPTGAAAEAYFASNIAMAENKVPTGISGGKVVLNDALDHSWTLYRGIADDVDGGHYNSAYAGRLYLADPRDVKITYYGNGQATVINGSNTYNATTVQVGYDAPENTFVYYKTLENYNKTGEAEYTYRTICNPFSVRPKQGSDYYGFSYWRLKSISGGSISGVALNGRMEADTEYTFIPAGEYGMEVELEAVWEPATVVTAVNSLTSSNNRGSVERNFCVLTSNSSTTTITASSYPCTYTSLYPNGTTDGTTAATGISGTRRSDFTAKADSKFEYINLNDNSSTITASGYNLTIGRGVQNSSSGGVCANVIYGTNANVTNPKYHLVVESGVYNYMSFFGGYYTQSGGTEGNTRTITVNNIANTNVRVTVGSDYDRAAGTNSHLKLKYAMSMARVATFTAANRDNPNTLDLYVKSGLLGSELFMDNTTDAATLQGGAGYGHYMSSGGSQTNVGGRNIYIEGGELCTIGSGIDQLNNAPTGSTTVSTTENLGREGFHFRMSGGKIHGNVYGGAAYSPSGGNRQMIVTGGHIMGWLAAGCNGTDNSGGQNYGTAWVYFGGNGSLNSSADNTEFATGIDKTLGYAQGGNLYAAGAGRQGATTCGEMTFGTNLVVADNAYVQRGIYGGGNYGYALQYSYIYVTGGVNAALSDTATGAVGGVYGGANNQNGPQINMYMTGGRMLKGIYGGSNTQGTISANTVVGIYGGQVGAEGAGNEGTVCGGGLGSRTAVSGNVTVTVGGAEGLSPLIYGDVYGGSESGTVNTNTSNSTSVTLASGSIVGSLYGGGNGKAAAANVNGNVSVTVHGGSVSDAVYGCNNAQGAPQGTVSVTVNGTDSEVNAVNHVFGGGNRAAYGGVPVVLVTSDGDPDTKLYIKKVYGGGNEAAVAGTDVTVEGGTRINYVYGGGLSADVNGNTSVTIKGGNVGEVFGGNDAAGSIAGSTNVTIDWGDAPLAHWNIGNVYGGGNLAAYTGSTHVNFVRGNGTGSVYGGGYGSSAVVTGTTEVKVGQWGSVGNATVERSVFGGGALAAVEGDVSVTVRNCDTKICGDLYGGGDAAPVYSTNTVVYGGKILGNVYGGGNGSDPSANPKGAQIGYKRDDTTAGGSGNVTTGIYGGTIGTWTTDPETDEEVCADNTGGIFGGSNTNGNILGDISLTIDKQGEPVGATLYQCPLVFSEAYGAGRLAPYVSDGDLTFTIGCLDGMDCIYGGAKQTDFKGDINLVITNGTIGRVFGGNNLSGNIDGTITVTIDETGCNPVIIGEVYGGGNLAAYTGDPVVNILSCTSIGAVYGGGYGATAVVTGNPTVNVLQIPGIYKEDGTTVNTTTLGLIGEIYGGGNAAKVIGNTTVNIATKTTTQQHEDTGTDATAYTPGANVVGFTDNIGTVRTGNVYGGGNIAPVTGTTKVNIGH